MLDNEFLDQIGLVSLPDVQTRLFATHMSIIGKKGWRKIN